jgi:hypothetical protein
VSVLCMAHAPHPATHLCFVFLQASAGLAYSFSVYAPTIKDSLDLTQTQVATVGSAVNLGGYFAILSGSIYDSLKDYHKLGPRYRGDRAVASHITLAQLSSCLALPEPCCKRLQQQDGKCVRLLCRQLQPFDSCLNCLVICSRCSWCQCRPSYAADVIHCLHMLLWCSTGSA